MFTALGDNCVRNRGTLDELMGYDMVDDDASRMLGATYLAQQDVDGGVGHCRHGLMDGGQFRPDHGGG